MAGVESAKVATRRQAGVRQERTPPAWFGSRRPRGGRGHDGRVTGRPGISASCATVCSMLASRPWPVNMALTHAFETGPDDRVQPTGADGRPRRREERGRIRRGRPFPPRVRTGARAPADRAAGVPRPAIRPRAGSSRCPLDPARPDDDRGAAGRPRREPCRHRPPVRCLARRRREPPGGPGRRARRPRRRAACAVHARGPRRAGDQPPHPTPIRGERRHPRLGIRGVRRDPPRRERGHRLAWAARGAGPGPLCAGRPIRLADDHARHVRREPGRGLGLRPQPDRRRAPLAARHRARDWRAAGRPAPRAAGRRTVGQRRPRRGGHALPWLGQSAHSGRSVPGPGGGLRGPPGGRSWHDHPQQAGDRGVVRGESDERDPRLGNPAWPFRCVARGTDRGRPGDRARRGPPPR